MSKIEEFEKRIIEQGMNDDDFVKFGNLLKRVQSNFLKRQHCYTTAIQFPIKNAEQAIKLINYGLMNFEDGWFSTYTSYMYIGHIYETIGDYQTAYESYLSAQSVLDDDSNTYREESEKKLLWMRLHIDSFKYSEELEYHYLRCAKSNEFSEAFINTQFIMAIAKIVIALHYNKSNEASQGYEEAMKICKPNYIGKIQDILSKHHYKESLNMTAESLKFLTEIKL